MTDNIKNLRENRDKYEKETASARKHLSMLFDGGAFTELNPFMTPDPAYPAGGIVCAYGEICGNPAFAFAHEPSALGGAFGRVQGKKIKNMYEKACRLGVPIFGILDSKGVRLEEGTESFALLGEIYGEMSRASGVVPQITLIAGDAMGSMSLIPALSDFSFALNKSKVFMTSPETKRVAKSTEKGTFISKKFDSEEEMFDFARNLMSFLPKNNAEASFSPWEKADAYIAELNENVYETKDILSLVSDGNNYTEIFGSSSLTLGFARFGGFCAAAIGFSGEDADAESLEKCAEFVSFADAFSMPVVTLTSLSGFSSEDRDEKIVQAAARLTLSFANATVPKINVITEKLIGAPLTFLNSKMTGADMVYVWADAKIGLMTSDAAVNVLQSADFVGAADVEGLKAEKLSEYVKKDLNPMDAAKIGLADDIIEPAETRAAIISALSLFYTKSEKALPLKKHPSKSF